MSRVAEAARDHGGFTEPNAWESLVRGWHLEGLAVRPEHRMHAHTGFLISTRRLADGVAAPLVKRRPAKGAYGDDGAPASAPEPTPDDAWTPEAVGERPVSDKKMRKLVRSFENTPTAQALAGDDIARAPESAAPAGSDDASVAQASAGSAADAETSVAAEPDAAAENAEAPVATDQD